MKNVVDKRIAVMGGTFNPIHTGHLIIAEMIKEEFGLDKIIFLPSGKPPHKNLYDVSDVEHRFNMVCKATSGNSGFLVSRIEIERKGYTYTIDTLKELRETYGEDACLFYLIGADVLHDLFNWKCYEEVFKICEFIAALRPGYDVSGFDERIHFFENHYSAKIHKAEIPLIDISSTLIRNKVKEGKSVRYLLPETVEKYIRENGLYI